MLPFLAGGRRGRHSRPPGQPPRSGPGRPSTERHMAEPGSRSFLLNSVVTSCCLIGSVFSVQPAGEIAQQLWVVLGLLLSISQSPVAARNQHLDGTGHREAVIPSPKMATAIRKMVVFPRKCSCSSLLIKKMESHHGKESQAL